MSRLQLSRRSVLRGSAGSLLALPLLQAMLPSRSVNAQAVALPKRFVVVAVGNGTFPERFWPSLGGKTFPADYMPVDLYTSGRDALETTAHTMAPIMEPLIPHQQDCLVLEGIDNCKGQGGHSQYAALLASRDATRNNDAGPDGPTIDQVIATHFAGQTRFPSLQFGVHNGDQEDAFGSLCWYGDGKRAPAENNPYRMFDRLFGDLPAAGAQPNQALELLRAQRKSVLDSAIDQAAALQKRLGTEDRAKVQNYLESMRSIEMQLLGVSGPRAATCQAPTIAQGLHWDYDPNAADAPEIAKVQIDQLVMSLACDLTRVATLQIFCEGHSLTHPWLGINIGHHSDIAHQPDLPKLGMLVKIGQWNASLVAYLIERLKATPEGDGTMLDNTLVLWVNGMTKGSDHSNSNQPTLVAGNMGGYFKTGRYIRFKRDGTAYPMGTAKSYGDFYVEVLRAMTGMEVDTFGDPAFIHGGMPEIRA